MDKNEGIRFLFDIAKEIKRSYESPVIYFTLKDYADGIYRALVDTRGTIQRNGRIAEIVTNFHLDWLRAVREIEDFKKRIKDTPREVILNAVEFTSKSVQNRFTTFKSLQQNLKLRMSIEDRLIMQADIEIMKDMKDSVIAILGDKKTCFMYNADHVEYFVKVNYEVEELLNWLDRLNDSLALQICRAVHLQQLPRELMRTLKQAIDEVNMPPALSNLKIEKLESKNKLLGSMLRLNASHDLEFTKLTEKIKLLEERIQLYKEEDSSAALALQHKIIYLEERLQSLENLKQSLNVLRQDQNKEIDESDVLYSTEIQIFNHNLPNTERSILVERLLKLWDSALCGDGTAKSIISILSAADLNEVFTDDIGQFTVDGFGRKLYTSEDDTVYQLNERNELVPVKDDDNIYYYDDIGRYFLDEHRRRIYKAFSDASEYELCNSGKLLKLREVIGGVEYKYDHNGRYYMENGKKIYTDVKTGERYEQDGFGNLVLDRSADLLMASCPDEPMVVKECKYLKDVVGDALKQCIANVLLHQPADPIGFLADSLVKYWHNMEERQRRIDDKKELDKERELNPDFPPPLSYGIEEQSSRSSIDYHYHTYKHAGSEETF